MSIGERRKPDPQGRQGYLRVDTVHQGDDVDGSNGAYHINAVEEVTQWEVVGRAPQISEAFLIPVEAPAAWELWQCNWNAGEGPTY